MRNLSLLSSLDIPRRGKLWQSAVRRIRSLKATSHSSTTPTIVLKHQSQLNSPICSAICSSIDLRKSSIEAKPGFWTSQRLKGQWGKISITRYASLSSSAWNEPLVINLSLTMQRILFRRVSCLCPRCHLRKASLQRLTALCIPVKWLQTRLGLWRSISQSTHLRPLTRQRLWLTKESRKC